MYDKFTAKCSYFPERTEKHSEEIQEKLWVILDDLIKNSVKDHEICYLGLYGSQNYGLDTPDSDIDCECFIFPTMEELIFAKPMKSTTVNTKYGTCVIKDIRMMFNELRKISPNILEVLSTDYGIINKDYYCISDVYHSVNLYAQMSTYKLLKGLEGLYRKYKNDAIGNCKYYANMLRMIELINRVLDDPYYQYSMILYPKERDYLYWVKTCSDFDKVFNEDYFNDVCFTVEKRLEDYYNSNELTFNPTYFDMSNEHQRKIMSKYIKLNV